MRRFFLLLAAAACACGGDDGGGPAGNDGGTRADAAAPPDDAMEPPGACVFGEECPAEAPICDVEAHECTGCTLDSTCGRFDAQPFCRDGACVACSPADFEAPGFCPPGRVCDGATGTCRLCAAGSECESGVCGRTACIDQGYVLYVAPGGSTTSDCTRDAPCGRIQRAILVASGDRRIVHLAAGVYSESVTINESNTADTSGGMTFIGEEGATISPALAGVAALRMRGQLEVNLIGTTLAGATGAAGHGVECDVDSADPFAFSLLDMTRSLVRDNAGDGIATTGCALRLDGTTVMGNGGHGVNHEGLLVEVRRSSLRDNGGLGLRARGCGEGSRADQVIASGNRAGGISALCWLGIANSWIVRNGAAGSAIGGARLGEGAWIGLTTVADNRADPGAPAAGVVCADQQGIGSSIVHGNLGGAPAIGPSCLVTRSLVAPGPVPDGVGNLAGEPAFVDPAAGNYDLGPGSDAIDRGVFSDGYDIHGDPRDAAPDLGGDEYHAP